jgi:predicted membrane-bound spermidine synthase
LSLLFLASGMAALVYQVAWQRTLFAAFGADLESVTIIVSAFMLGLGIGALIGGLAADRWPRKRLSLFAVSEAGIGAFGICSPFVFGWAGRNFVNWPTLGIASVNFLLVVLPTMLMGATLPILIAHVTQRWAHVGAATGHLYSLNTLGAALGSVAAGFWLFHHLTLNQSIWLASSINLGAAALAYWKLREPGHS